MGFGCIRTLNRVLFDRLHHLADWLVGWLADKGGRLRFLTAILNGGLYYYWKGVCISEAWRKTRSLYDNAILDG
jgi:hypothetical protein